MHNQEHVDNSKRSFSLNKKFELKYIQITLIECALAGELTCSPRLKKHVWALLARSKANST